MTDNTTHSVAYGVDGCKGGWFYFELAPTISTKYGVVKTLDEIFERATTRDLILVDMPIGLPEEGHLQAVARVGDLKARERLGAQARSVFSVPVRSVAETLRRTTKWGDAQAVLSKEHPVPKGRRGRLTAQSFAILKKIREVDDLLCGAAPDKRKILRETHPEVCFHALNGKGIEFPKKHGLGFRERVRVLEKTWSGATDAIEKACRAHPRVGGDDIVDAMACAVTAALIVDGRSAPRTLPENPPRDPKGLPMEIVYADRPE